MTKIKRNTALFGLSLCLMACQPQRPDAAAQQQNFICSALIDGFLTAQKLTHYQLWKIQPTLYSTASQRLYIYQAQGSNTVNLLPRQQKLRFSCEQISARQFQIKLAATTQKNTETAETVLSIELPEPAQIKQLTAYTITESNAAN